MVILFSLGIDKFVICQVAYSSDPSPIIGYACHSHTHSLTDSLTNSLLLRFWSCCLVQNMKMNSDKDLFENLWYDQKKLLW